MVQKPNYNNPNYDLPENFSNVNTKNRFSASQINDGFNQNDQGSLGKFFNGYHLNWILDHLFRWVKYLVDRTDITLIPIKIDIGTNSTYQANTDIPLNALVEKVVLVKDTSYSSGTTIEVTLPNSLVIMLQSENNPQSTQPDVAYKYTTVGASNIGKPSVNISGLPSVGSGKVIIYYRTGFEN